MYAELKKAINFEKDIGEVRKLTENTNCEIFAKEIEKILNNNKKEGD